MKAEESRRERPSEWLQVKQNDTQEEETHHTEERRRLRSLIKRRRANVTSLSYHYKLVKKHLFTIWIAWTLMNPDPSYPKRAIGSLVAASLLRSARWSSESGLMRSSFFRSNRGGSANGMNAMEAIALIHAINGGRSGGGGGGSSLDSVALSSLLSGSDGRRGSGPSAVRQLQQQQLSRTGNELQRQLVPPFPPVPILPPFPPVPTLPPAPVPFVVALAAFFAAVAAGFPPFAAIFVFIAAFFASLIVVPFPPKAAPLIKKLVIKKTIVPVVVPIPITIPIKKDKKEIIYMSKGKKHQHKEEHHEVYEYKPKKKKKKMMMMAKMDELDVEPQLRDDKLEQQRDSIPPTGATADKLDSLISEQVRIQDLMDQVVEANSSDRPVLNRSGARET